MDYKVDWEFISDLIDLGAPAEERPRFIVDNDHKADWAVETIMEHIAERDRLIAIVDAKAQELQERKRQIIESAQRKTQYLSDCLQDYFATVKPSTTTKTTTKYNLVHGSLVLRRQQPEYLRDEPAMIDWARQVAPAYIKTRESIDWAELKKQTAVDGETVVLAETGEVIPGVVARPRPDLFEVKANENH